MRSWTIFALLVSGVASSPLQITSPVNQPIGGAVIATNTLGTVGGALVQPVRARSHIPILHLTQHVQGGLSDKTNFQTGNGISVSEETQVVKGRGGSYLDENGQVVQTDSTLVKTGTISYLSPEGVPVTLSYIADENGFRPQGSHIGQPAPVPKVQQTTVTRPNNLASAVFVQPSYNAASILPAQSHTAPLQTLIAQAPQYQLSRVAQPYQYQSQPFVQFQPLNAPATNLLPVQSQATQPTSVIRIQSRVAQPSAALINPVHQTQLSGAQSYIPFRPHQSELPFYTNRFQVPTTFSLPNYSTHLQNPFLLQTSGGYQPNY